MVQVSDYLTDCAILCNYVTCFGKLWCRPFQWYINHFIPISSSWDMNQSFNISKSFGHFFGSLYIVACSKWGEIMFRVNVKVWVVTFVHIEWQDTCSFTQGIVVSELCEGKKLGPIILLVTTVMSKVLFECLIDTLCLTICLGMICGQWIAFNVEKLVKLLHHFSIELRTSIIDYLPG